MQFSNINDFCIPVHYNKRAMLKDSTIKSYISVKQFDHEYNNQVSRIFRERLIMDSETSIISFKGAILGKLRESNPFNLLQINCISGYFENASVNLEFEINDWQPENYICIPAAVYNGNRFESRKIPYSPKLIDENDIGPEKPIIITDIPRLNKNKGFSKIQLKTGSTTMPCVGIFMRERKKMFWIFTSNRSSDMETGICIEENANKSKLRISISLPAVRELRKYKITNSCAPVDDKGITLKTGDKFDVPYKVELRDALSLNDFFSYYFDQRMMLQEEKIKPSFSLSSCFDAIEKKYNEHNWVEDPGYYSVGMRNGKYRFLQDWQLGWTGGMISTLPLLLEGSDKSAKQCLNHYNWFFNAPLCPAGLFWDSGEQGNKWYGGDIRRKHTSQWHLTRKSADAVYYLAKQFKYLDDNGISVPDEWKTKTQQVIKSLLAIWNKNGQLGQFINSESGKIEVGGSTSAAILPAGLVLSSVYFGKKAFAKAAEYIAEQLYADFMKTGLTCGGPGDALQAADSESAYGLLESMIRLYEQTNDQKWLERACTAAHYLSTWVMAYNFTFPKESPLGALDVTTKGSVFANTQNTHGAPGICTYSGIALLKLFRYTKNVRFLKLLQEITQNIPQYLSHPNRPIPGMQEGFVSERINTCDWLEGVGELMYGSTWSEVSLMLTYAEIPGVYVVPDMNLAISFDHLKTTLNVNDGQYNIEILNPTKSVARFYLLRERSKDFDTNLDMVFFSNKKKIILKPLEKTILTFEK